MRIVGLRQGAQECLDHVIILHLANVAEDLVVSAGDRFLRRPEFEFRKIFLEEFCFDAILPDSVRFLLDSWARSVLPVDLHRAAAVESIFLLGELLVLGDTVFHALPETGKISRAGPRSPRKTLSPSVVRILAREFVNIRLCEVQLVVIKCCQVSLKKSA